MKSLPMVSVVMPSLNQVQFLESAVRSVLEQDYQNLELVVVDGMSSDGSLELISSLQAEYKDRIRWVCKRDNGAAEAINHAISISEGSLIGWLNSDDMYMQGALTRAVDCFNSNPSFQMVYGNGLHIDTIGLDLGAYPTKPPSTPLRKFADGSFICQPTVFMRKEALDEVGPLDASIRTAFDFDLFLRFFKRYPGRIGMVASVQALSRLHPECMTQRLRSQVALDGMHVVAKELGDVPAHWFWTHIKEIFEKYPFSDEKLPLLTRIKNFLKEASAYLTPEMSTHIATMLMKDERLRLVTPELFANVEPDGWVSKHLTIKYRWDGVPAVAIRVKCLASWPIQGQMNLKIMNQNGDMQHVVIGAPDDFTLRLEVPCINKSGSIMWLIESCQGFIPSSYDKKSTDTRKLSFRVLELSAEY